VDTFAAIGRYAVAILAGTLPRRHWVAFEDRLPVTAMAVPSALLPMGLALGIGLPAFLAYGRDLAAANVDAALDLAQRSPEMTGAAPVAFSVLAFFLFALTTGRGLLCTYLTFAGLHRVLCAAVSEPRGDPLLTAADRLADGRLRRAREARAEAGWAAEAGPEVPDRLMPGTSVGMPEADLVVVASRPKPGWERGVVVITAQGWFRIGTPVDRRLGLRRRALYPLAEVKDIEVLRRHVTYDLPPRMPWGQI